MYFLYISPAFKIFKYKNEKELCIFFGDNYEFLIIVKLKDTASGMLKVLVFNKQISNK